LAMHDGDGRGLGAAPVGRRRVPAHAGLACTARPDVPRSASWRMALSPEPTGGLLF
jgi:hypothetical protein